MTRLRRLLPRSIAGQVILVLLVGLSVSHVASMVIYSTERLDSMIAFGGGSIAQRTVNAARLIGDAPPTWRADLIDGLDEPGFRVGLRDEKPSGIGGGPRTDGERSIERAIERHLNAGPDRPVGVRLTMGVSSPDAERARPMGGLVPHALMMLKAAPVVHRLEIAVPLSGGAWLDVIADIPEPPSLWSTEAALSMSLMALTVVVLGIWMVRKATRPLRLFAAAAERLGRDVAAPPLREDGPAEVERAARAFNDMQARLRRLIENRTRMLAAISHDLRTPITLLRLRAELIDDVEERDKTLGTLDRMEAMIASTLSFARQDAEDEPRKTVDMVALVEAVCVDAADTGADIAFKAETEVAVACAPLAMRRALSNLVDNAAKHGRRVTVTVEDAQADILIHVDDDGPGIPADRIEDAFTPFVRLDDHRGEASGGVGLGLSVARTVVHAHGGEIDLVNRPEGGLRATIRLPR